MTEYKIKFINQLSEKLKNDIEWKADDISNRYDISIRSYHASLYLAAELAQYPDMKEDINNLINRIKDIYGEDRFSMWDKVFKNLSEKCVDKRMRRYIEYLPACHIELKKNIVRETVDKMHVMYKYGCSDIVANYAVQN